MQSTMLVFLGVFALLIQCGEPLIADLLQRDSTARALPVQMDMASEAGITICTGQTRGISCRDGANMAITNAFWGRISDKVCPSDDGDPVTDCQGSRDTLPLVKKKCEGKKECKLSAKHKELQNDGSSHCAGVNKYLVVNYTCEPESQGVTLCDSVETDLFCRAGWVMDLADVFWGRRASTKTCGGDGEIECDASENAGTILKKKCNGQNRCHIRADAGVLDPKTHASCNGILKYLMVNYICKPKEMFNTAEDSEDMKVPSKDLLGLVNQIDKIQTAKPVPKPAAGNAAKVKASNDNAYKNIKKDETPSTDNESEHSAVNEESLGEPKEQKGETKTQIPESKPEAKIELAEPNTVRSILDRAKEVLKTLDYDSSDSDIAKRGGITRSQNGQPTSKFVNDTAKAVKQVAALAQTLVKHAEAKAMLKTKTQNLLKKTIINENKNGGSSPAAKTQIPGSNAVDKKTYPQFKRSGFIVEQVPAHFGNTP